MNVDACVKTLPDTALHYSNHFKLDLLACIEFFSSDDLSSELLHFQPAQIKLYEFASLLKAYHYF